MIAVTSRAVDCVPSCSEMNGGLMDCIGDLARSKIQVSRVVQTNEGLCVEKKRLASLRGRSGSAFNLRWWEANPVIKKSQCREFDCKPKFEMSLLRTFRAEVSASVPQKGTFQLWSTSVVVIKKKLRRLSTVGSHDLTRAAGPAPAAFSLCPVMFVIAGRSNGWRKAFAFAAILAKSFLLTFAYNRFISVLNSTHQGAFK